MDWDFELFAIVRSNLSLSLQEVRLPFCHSFSTIQPGRLLVYFSWAVPNLCQSKQSYSVWFAFCPPEPSIDYPFFWHVTNTAFDIHFCTMMLIFILYLPWFVDCCCTNIARVSKNEQHQHTFITHDLVWDSNGLFTHKSLQLLHVQSGA